MKVDKLISKNQPSNWFNEITNECRSDYPIHLVDIDASEVCIDMGCNVGGFSEAWNYRFHNILANIKVDTLIKFYTMQYHQTMVILQS